MSGLNAYFMFISHIFLPSHPFKKYSRMEKHFKISKYKITKDIGDDDSEIYSKAMCDFIPR